MNGEKNRPGLARRILNSLGLGVITGAADDDPSGIATYSIAGAQHGLALLWTALLTWPLMAFVQMMCARIGMVSGRGLAGAIRQRFPRPVVLGVALALFAANSINVGADLSGMADAAEMLTTINSHIYVVVFGVGISLATIFFRYHQIATILKWLALVLFAYVITGFIVHPDWSKIGRAALMPSWPKSHDQWGALVAIFGTTISPYLFFWQASQEVEEDKAKGRRMLYQRFGASSREIIDRKIDVDVGTFFSNLVMFFIIVTTALTLHVHGLTNIESSRDAAQALFPLAGRFAGTLFTIGIVGVGLLAIPTLTGSAAYALAETFAWREGLDQRFRGAPFLSRDHRLDAHRHHDGFSKCESRSRTLLDRCHQWSACSGVDGCDHSYRARSPRYERPTQFDSQRDCCFHRNAVHVRRSNRDVRVLENRSRRI